MAAKLGELLNMVLQLNASDRAQAELDLQTQQQHLGNLNQFIGALGRVRHPEELSQLKQFFANNGVPLSTLDEVARQYTPTMAQLQEQTAQAGLTSLPTQELAGVQKEAGVRAVTGVGTGQLAESQQLAQDYADPSINTPTAQRAGFFARTGFDPGRFAMSEATANLSPGELKSAARIAGGTQIGAPTLADLMLRRDEFQTQAQLALQQFNRGVFESDRMYPHVLFQDQMEAGYKQAQIAELRRKAALGDQEAIKELGNMLQGAQKAAGSNAGTIYSQMIENQIRGINQSQQAVNQPNIFNPPPAGSNYQPGWWEKHF